jgi:hypothetical protein
MALVRVIAFPTLDREGISLTLAPNRGHWVRSAVETDRRMGWDGPNAGNNLYAGSGKHRNR